MSTKSVRGRSRRRLSHCTISTRNRTNGDFQRSRGVPDRYVSFVCCVVILLLTGISQSQTFGWTMGCMLRLSLYFRPLAFTVLYTSRESTHCRTILLAMDQYNYAIPWCVVITDWLVSGLLRTKLVASKRNVCVVDCYVLNGQRLRTDQGLGSKDSRSNDATNLLQFFRFLLPAIMPWQNLSNEKNYEEW